VINWHKGTWDDGDTAEYHGSRPKSYCEVFPGLYWYCGFGSGTFFRSDGTMLLNCTPQEANAEARRLGLQMCYIDSFDTRGLVNVGG
jgi:hypothetical protein